MYVSGFCCLYKNHRNHQKYSIYVIRTIFDKINPVESNKLLTYWIFSSLNYECLYFYLYPPDQKAHPLEGILSKYIVIYYVKFHICIKFLLIYTIK